MIALSGVNLGSTLAVILGLSTVTFGIEVYLPPLVTTTFDKAPLLIVEVVSALLSSI